MASATWVAAATGLDASPFAFVAFALWCFGCAAWSRYRLKWWVRNRAARGRVVESRLFRETAVAVRVFVTAGLVLALVGLLEACGVIHRA